MDTTVVIGPRARKPLALEIPLFVSDMSFGALSEEAKTALATGAEMAGTGICSGEGGMLPEEQAANSRYFYELASARFGYSLDKVQRCQAFHFKGGQGAKTGTGGHLPGIKVVGKIAEVRGLTPGTSAISPSRFTDLCTTADFRAVADEVREATGGIPIGYKMSAQHIEADIDAALDIGVDYIILDGRGGGTGAAPNIFKHNISVPTLPALARAAAPRSPRERCHADHHRRAAHRSRLRQGIGAWRGCGGAVQLGNPGNRVPGHAGLPHQQLSRRYRDPATASAGAADRRGLRQATEELPACVGRVDEAARPCLWACAVGRLQYQRPDDLEAGDRPPDRRELRRRRSSQRGVR